MYYFVNTELGLKIRNINRDISNNQYYTRFTQEQLDFYEQYPNATVMQVWNLTPPEQPHEKTLEEYKLEKIGEIISYDTSDGVNQFFYNDIPMWLDKATRVGLVNSLNSAELVGTPSINIWYEGISINLPITQARYLLAQLEMYAVECYNVTEQHKVEVNNLETISDVIEYDITLDYPEKLRFSTNNE